MTLWQPTADLENLAKRAQLLSQVRFFFAERSVMEVETPLLGAAPVTDPNIEAIAAQSPADSGQLYLQTSPEYAMKRLLAAGSGPIYQICKAFRRGERGRRHNPEFTMLEWYRPGLSLAALMDEVAALISMALDAALPVERLSYRSAFTRYCGLDPHDAGVAQLRALAQRHMELNFDSDERDVWLQLLMASVVEPALDPGKITFIDDFPPEQAALAVVETGEGGRSVARRFEAFFGGMELANGYCELRDAAELGRRFQRDLAHRRAAGQTLPPVDERLLAAMAAGLPECVGVAMGLDRLVMLACGAGALDEVISFPLERA